MAAKQAGIMAGRFALFIPALLKPRPAFLRALLWSVWRGVTIPELPAPGLVSVDRPAAWPDGIELMMGWVPAGPVLVRLDIAERVGRELHYLIRRHPALVPDNLTSRLSCKPDQLSPVLNALGLRIIPAAALDAKKFGPPSPPMLARRKAAAPRTVRPVQPDVSPPAPDNPFAALAALKRA
jgi:ATP-dependent RNA helicase SUPV3L1/SUV3